MHGYAFNSMNRLEKAWDSEGKEAEYFYNALGQRTARSTAEETEEYLLDLTKPYHNLLERQKGKHRQTFYWDMNVSAMEDENRTLQYYLQDELGSPLRVLYRSGSGAAYGYDEFGADLYDPEKNPCAGRQYSRQGEHQPFGFTGYRYDDISGTYFAQAREYQPGEGRFTAEDILRGRNTIPKTLNRYGYCWGNPIQYVDVNGRDPITPQDIQKGFWESVLNAADRVVDDFSYQMDCIENDIKDAVNEGYQMVKDGVQTGLDFLGDTVHKAADFAMDTVNDGVHLLRDYLLDCDFTYTEGITISGTLALYQIAGALGISGDSDGNMGLQFTLGAGWTTASEPSAAIQKYYSITNAPDIFALEKEGTNIGASYALKLKKIIAAFGLDLNLIGDINKHVDYIGATFLAGVATAPGGDVHVQLPYTWTLFSINVFETWDYLYNKYYGREWLYKDIIKCCAATE